MAKDKAVHEHYKTETSDSCKLKRGFSYFLSLITNFGHALYRGLGRCRPAPGQLNATFHSPATSWSALGDTAVSFICFVWKVLVKSSH